MIIKFCLGDFPIKGSLPCGQQLQNKSLHQVRTLLPVADDCWDRGQCWDEEAGEYAKMCTAAAWTRLAERESYFTSSKMMKVCCCPIGVTSWLQKLWSQQGISGRACVRVETDRIVWEIAGFMCSKPMKNKSDLNRIFHNSDIWSFHYF